MLHVIPAENIFSTRNEIIKLQLKIYSAMYKTDTEIVVNSLLGFY